MSKFVIGASLLAIAAGATAGTPAIIAYWNQNSNALPGGGFGFEVGDFPQGADNGTQAGSATLTVGGGDALANDGAVYTWLQSFTGSGINAQFGDPSGGSIALQGGTDTVNNGAFFEFNFNASLYENIQFSLARQSTSTGFNTVAIDAFDGDTLLGNIGSINNRLDNIVVAGTLIPTPGAAALLGLGGLVAARRRRA
jgi:hypothetical protein